jgi:hypothetical protein
VFVAGTTGYDYATMTISGDVTYILPDRNDWPASWPVTRQVFADVRPGSTTMMAGLQDPAMKIEIEVTVRLPRRARTRSDADEGAGAP